MAVRVTRANFGGWMNAHYTTEGVSMWIDGATKVLEHGVLRPAANASSATVPPETGPFEIADFGDRTRMSWATGAFAIASVGRCAYWRQRFVAWVTPQETLIVIDANRPVVVTLSVAGLFEDIRTYGEFRSHKGALWFEGPLGVLVSIEHAELEALFDRPPGAIQVVIQETYPNHKPEQTKAAVVASIAKASVTVKVRGERETAHFTIPRFEGAANGLDVQLRDEIMPDVFRVLELADGRKIELREKPVSSRNLTAHLAIDPAVDPAGGPIVVGEKPSRQADLDRLFEALADDPEDATTREILIDLLEDSGEPYAAALHELVAGADGAAKRKAALGPLTNFLVGLEYAGGLPNHATLSTQAPPDPIIVDAIVTDQRWGLFHTLRIGDGAFAVYAKLVASPRAVGLRHVDAPNAKILTALVAGKRTRLTALSNVKFTTRAVIDGLADPTFDRVVDLHTETTADIIAMQLEFFIRDEAGFFARAPRHLVLTERLGQEHELVKWVTAAWPRLPVAAVTCGALKLRR